MTLTSTAMRKGLKLPVHPENRPNLTRHAAAADDEVLLQQLVFTLASPHCSGYLCLHI